jgi:hypothetical protein
MQRQFTIFSQLIKLFPRYQFDRIVKRYAGDKNVRSLSCWTQFIALLFAQFTGRKSLRDLEISFNSHFKRHYHLGCKTITRSSLADANHKRSANIYTASFEHLLQLTGSNIKQVEVLNIIDSTQVILNSKFKWATGQSKNGVKIHVVYDSSQARPIYFDISNIKKNDILAAKELTIAKGSTYIFDRGYYSFSWWNEIDKAGSRFITRLKSNSPLTLLKERKAIDNEEFDVISDSEAFLNERLTSSRKNPYNRSVRVIRVRLKNYSNKEAITIVSNDLKSSAIKLCKLYKQRWQIELFFKWIKQNLKIKSFLGSSENAVKIQVTVAMIAYILSQYLLKLSKAGITLQRFCQLLQTKLMENEYLQNLLNPPPILTSAIPRSQLWFAI